MATMPDDEMTEAPEAPDAEMQEGEVDDGSYCIEIKVMPDGTFTVGVESSAYEAAEEQGAEAAGESKEEGKSYGSIKEALTAVLDIVKNKGSASDSAPLERGMEKAQMSAGFNEGKM